MKLPLCITRTLPPLLALALVLVLVLVPAAPADASPSTATAVTAPSAASARPPRKKPRRSRKKAAQEPPPAPAADPDGAPLRRSDRMEFDARVVKGERPGSGAVYLFNRAPRRLPPLVRLQQSVLEKIVRPVLGRGAMLKPKPGKQAPTP